MECNVVHLRLVNSDEVLGELEKIEDDKVYLIRPMIVDEREDPRTKGVNVVLTKYILFNTSKSVPFKIEHIITQSNVLPEISDFYFNSIEYNERFLEPAIVKDIAKTNDMIREFLDYQPEMIGGESADYALNDVEPTVHSEKSDNQVRIIVYPSSNTIH